MFYQNGIVIQPLIYYTTLDLDQRLKKGHAQRGKKKTRGTKYKWINK